MRITIVSEKPKLRRNFLMQDEFNEEAIRREAKKVIKKEHKDIIEKTHGNYKMTWTY